MSIYLGVDAGGSKTHAVITDAHGRVLGKGVSGNGNHQLGKDRAERNIRQACEDALKEAGLTQEEIKIAYFGLAGADREPDYVILKPMIASLGFKRHYITCDTIIGMRAGTSQFNGAAIICGNGFNSAARNTKGDELQYGGFGFSFGDGFAGGSGLSTLAFRAMIRAWDERGPKTMLTDLVMEHMQGDSVEALYEDVLYERRDVPSDLVKTLFTAASQGDQVAIDILEREGAEMGNAVTALIRRLNMTEEQFDVVYIGSVLNKGTSPHLTNAIERVVKSQAPNARCVHLQSDPVAGAILSALDMDGVKLDAETEAKLKSLTV